MDKIVFFDLETGGLDPHAHPVIQFAAVAVTLPTFERVAEMELKVKFREDACDPDTLRAHVERGTYDPAAWEASARTERVALDTIAEFMRAHATVSKVSKAGKPYRVARIAAHNVRFDAEFLAAWFKAHAAFLPAAIYEGLDTLQLARWALLGDPDAPENCKLGTLATHYGLSLDNAHEALSDVRATVDLARILWFPQATGRT